MGRQGPAGQDLAQCPALADYIAEVVPRPLLSLSGRIFAVKPAPQVDDLFCQLSGPGNILGHFHSPQQVPLLPKNGQSGIDAGDFHSPEICIYLLLVNNRFACARYFQQGAGSLI